MSNNQRIKSEQYLGDGVYALFDGYQIWLKVMRDGREERIALEPEVFLTLSEFAGECWNIKTEPTPR